MTWRILRWLSASAARFLATSSISSDTSADSYNSGSSISSSSDNHTREIQGENGQ